MPSAPGLEPSSRIIFAAGPFTAAPPTIGETAITGNALRAIHAPALPLLPRPGRRGRIRRTDHRGTQRVRTQHALQRRRSRGPGGCRREAAYRAPALPPHEVVLEGYLAALVRTPGAPAHRPSAGLHAGCRSSSRPGDFRDSSPRASARGDQWHCEVSVAKAEPGFGRRFLERLARSSTSRLCVPTRQPGCLLRRVCMTRCRDPQIKPQMLEIVAGVHHHRQLRCGNTLPARQRAGRRRPRPPERPSARSSARGRISSAAEPSLRPA